MILIPIVLFIFAMLIPIAFGVWGRDIARSGGLRFGFLIGFFFGILGIFTLYLMSINNKNNKCNNKCSCKK